MMRYLVLLLVFSLGLQAEKIEFRDLTFDEGLAAAEKEGKPVFIDCFTDWCGPCKWMTANIFTDDKVAAYFNENYVCLKIDMEKGEGVDIAKRYQIRAYPTLLFLDAKGERLLVSVGANRDPQSYIDNGEQAQDPKRNLPYLTKNVEENMKNASFMYDYFLTLSAANMLPAGMVDRYFEQFEVNEWFEGDNWKIITRSVEDVNSQTFKVVLANAKELEEAQPEEGPRFIEQTTFYGLANMLYRARSEEARAKYENTKKELLDLNFPGSEKLAFRLDMLAFQRDEKFDDYAALASDNVEKYLWDDADELNNVSWNIYEKVKDPAALKAALKWAERAVELNDAHHILDTYAHLLAVNGQKEKALEVELKALEQAQEQGASTKNYESYIEELKS